MANAGLSDSKGSDTDVGLSLESDCETLDPLDNVVDIAREDIMATLHSDDDDDDEFHGFQNEWITKTSGFLPRQPRHCELDGGSSAHHPGNHSSILLPAILG